MQMRINADLVLELTPAEFYEFLRESEKAEQKAESHRNVLVSPTEPKTDTVEHQKPKAGDLIVITGDGQIGRLKSHGFPIGDVLVVRDYDAPDDRVYAGYLSSAHGMMIHNSFYEVVVPEPCPDCPLGHEEAPHVFEVGDIVRVTTSHAMSSRNKEGDIGEIMSVNPSGSYRVYVEARDDVTQGYAVSHGDNQKPDSFELVVAKKDRKDSAK